jgi:Tol biopolymer transport system component
VILIDTLANLLDYVVIAEDNWFGAGTYPSWSPDRSRFLLNVSYEVDNHSYSDFRMYTIDGVLERILADSAGTGEWSPDGSKIVFQKYTWMGDNPFPGDPDYGRVTVWICNPDGSDMQELLGWPQPPPDTTMFDGGYNWVTDTYDP